MSTVNVYCDESCHIEHDRQPVMVLGALLCPTARVRSLSEQIRTIKANHSLPPTFEAKWTKVSPAKIDFYRDLIGFFFETAEIQFRALVVDDKTKLKHEAFEQSHDTWYYKMYFEALRPVLRAGNQYRIYLDIKDTRSATKIRNLHNILCNSIYDFDSSVIERLQTIRSHESELMQIADLLTGAVGYANRGLDTSTAKRLLMASVAVFSGRDLRRTTPLSARKLNLFHWQPTEV